MNIKGWMDDILKKLTNDPDIEANINNIRCYLPDATYSPTYKKIDIYGNAPSILRYGIAHLLGHELAHHYHLKKYGDVGNDSSPEFQRIERCFINRIWDLCLEEHD